MREVYDSAAQGYDLRLVALAIFVCALASFTTLRILTHAARTVGHMREIWIWTAAAAGGSGIWATHFIAMLAYDPGVPSGYNLGLTVLSLFGAVVLCGAGLSCAASRARGAPWIGGSILGAGIAAMHYTGIAAYEIAGRLEWRPLPILLSVLLCSACGALAMAAAMRSASLLARTTGATLLTLAIAGHHVLAMNAIGFVPDSSVAVPEFAIPSGWLAVGVALASLTILLFACGGLALDAHERIRAKREGDRMRGLADAAVEGLLVCHGESIVTFNSSLTELTGYRAEDLLDAPLSLFLPDEAARRALLEQPKRHVESGLRRADGKVIPAEFILRAIDYGGRPHNAIAVRDLSDRKKAEDDIRFLAHHDGLTGLPNRNFFNARLDEEIEAHKASGLSLAILCLDLDRFKEVNDLFGHAAGDAVLKRVAECVTGVLDHNQVMARLGGDEFAIIATNIASPMAASRIAETVIETLRQDYETSASGNFISTSIGVAIFPNDAEDRRSLLTHADTALYRAKADGRAVYRFFEAAMGAEVRDRRILEHDLRNALIRRELRLVYQPQARASTGEVIGFEALLRWRHPERGDVSPVVFIPIAEESGTILQIGEWVLRTACQDATTWSQPLAVAVNVSTVQLHNQNFPQLVHEILLETGLAPRRLELEITETALVRDLNRALTTLRQLKTLGVRIAMDDFGTGYSSLSNLRSFPFDKIKIDKSFIKTIDVNQEAAAIVRAVLGLGRGLGLPVLAEGVETSGELEFLSAELCDEIQGWIVGRPAQIESFRPLTHRGAFAAGAPAPATEAFDPAPLRNAG
jgi:diguanylate cyclase (GGDEF)-like protein/PAS domain S-box-containing protein